MPDDARRKMPFFSALRERPHLPAELVRMPLRCEEDLHFENEQCCYYAVLKKGGYSDRLIEKELANLAALQERMAPAKSNKPEPELDPEEGAVAAWRRRKQSAADSKERRVREDIRESEEPPDGDYAVIDGERIPLG